MSEITDEMIEAGCAAIVEARGYVWPNGFDDDEIKTGRENMRLALEAALLAQRSAVREEIDGLRRALEPFAAIASSEELRRLCLGEDIDHWSADGRGVTLGDLRKARAALEAKP